MIGEFRRSAVRIFKVNLSGDKELIAILNQLPDALARNALRSAARAGARVLQQEAYMQLAMAVKQGSGARALDDVLVKQRRVPREPIQVQFDVGPPLRKPWLRWLHNGTKPHLIATRKETLTDGVRVFGRIIHHPGQPSMPWLANARFSSAGQVISAMAEALAPALSRQVAKLRSSKYTVRQLKRIFS